MDIRIAEREDLPLVARLVWLHAQPAEQESRSIEAFALDLREWCDAHSDSHLPFVAWSDAREPIGVAWLALIERVPRPGVIRRLSAQIQSVFVLPQHRGNGIGSTLVRTATEHAFTLGVSRVTVQSGHRAVPVYERLGFAPSPQLLQKLPPAETTGGQ